MMQAFKFLNCSILSTTARCPLQEGLRRGLSVTSVRNGPPKKGRKVKSKQKRPIQLPTTLFNPNFKEEHISASAGFEDMVEARSREFTDDLKSLTARGFHRFQKPYDPPSDAEEKFINMVKEVKPSLKELPEAALKKVSLNDSQLKYDILAKAAKEFQHAVPNSLLPAIRTIGAAVQFYLTPICTNTPFESLLRMDDLPPNLHIQKEPIRFTPETMDFFGGISAYPKDSTIITGLRAKEKYKAYKAKKQWP